MNHLRLARLVWLLIAFFGLSCSTELAELSPFPCAKDGSCPHGYSCNVNIQCLQTPSCTETESLCSAVCADLQTDASNCGACGKACAENEACCSGACVDESSDESACGACGMKCATGQTCTSGACVCPSKQRVCGDACVATNTDPKNCGGCGKACLEGASCKNGSCACPKGTTACDDQHACVDLMNDPLNCGECGAVCGGAHTDAQCVAGKCQVSCSRGFADCNDDLADGAKSDGCEKDLENDPNNCGSCKKTCVNSCSNGICCTSSSSSSNTCEVGSDCGCAQDQVCRYPTAGTACGQGWDGYLENGQSCVGSSQCQRGSVCARAGSGAYSCQPLCLTDTDCTKGMLCQPVKCSSGVTKAKLCVASGTLTLSTDANEQCCAAPASTVASCSASGTTELDQSCTTDQQCARGLACANGKCRTKCRNDRDCPVQSEHAPTRCVPTTVSAESASYTCATACDPLDPEDPRDQRAPCAAGEGCHVAADGSESSFCYPAGPVKEGQACSSFKDCAASLDCVNKKCVSYCESDAGCPTKVKCTLTFENNGIELGYCGG